MCTPGEKIAVGNNIKSVKSVITEDGIKIIFEDNSWFLIRPSGTEPKVRFYIETRVQDELEAMINTVTNCTKSILAQK